MDRYDERLIKSKPGADAYIFMGMSILVTLMGILLILTFWALAFGILFLALGGANQKPADMPYDEYIDDAVSMALDAYMTESGAATEAEEKVASKLNVLVEKMEELEKDYGGAFGIEDVAEETGYSVEEIKDLFKLAGEDLGK